MAGGFAVICTFGATLNFFSLEAMSIYLDPRFRNRPNKVGDTLAAKMTQEAMTTLFTTLLNKYVPVRSVNVSVRIF
jgi:hypothetical protein